MLKEFILEHRAISGTVGCIVALGVAGAYVVAVPEEAAAAPVYAQLILRYGHSLCWVLLAIASGLFATRGPAKITMGFAYSAAIIYAIFMLTLLITKE